MNTALLSTERSSLHERSPFTLSPLENGNSTYLFKAISQRTSKVNSEAEAGGRRRRVRLSLFIASSSSFFSAFCHRRRHRYRPPLPPENETTNKTRGNNNQARKTETEKKLKKVRGVGGAACQENLFTAPAFPFVSPRNKKRRRR